MKTWSAFLQEMQTPPDIDMQTRELLHAIQKKEPETVDYKGKFIDMLTRELLHAIQRKEPETVAAIKRVMFNAGIPGAGWEQPLEPTAPANITK
jgi:hypothetical protein